MSQPASPFAGTATCWIRRLVLAGLVLCFVVVVLGAYVRLTAAGLGCPDWPGCYGHVTPYGAQASAAAQAAFPSKPLDVGKAWREMIHRYAASTLGLIVLTLLILSLVTRSTRLISRRLTLALLAIVVVQGLLGMLTVTWRLKPLIVTAHLVFGLTTLSLLWWLWLSRNGPGAGRASGWVRPLLLVGLAALGVQIALGGWTSSNYAAIACPDFPTCQGSWWPPADFRGAFVLWRGLDINFEGGILDNPARVAIHLTHRMGAMIAALTLTCGALAVLLGSVSRRGRLRATFVLLALALQLTLGISMVREGFPLWLATAHTAGAALLLLSVLALLQWLPSSPARAPI